MIAEIKKKGDYYDNRQFYDQGAGGGAGSYANRHARRAADHRACPPAEGGAGEGKGHNGLPFPKDRSERRAHRATR